MDPASLLRKSARLYRDNTAFVCGQRRLSYAELYERSGRLALPISVILDRGRSRRSPP